MKVSVKCFSSLADAETCDYRNSTTHDLSEGGTVLDLLETAGIEKSEVKIVFVNSKVAGLGEILSGGDQIGLAPATGGM